MEDNDEISQQIKLANLALEDYNHHTIRKNYFGLYGVKWHEELGLAIDALTEARDILQGIFDQLAEKLNARST